MMIPGSNVLKVGLFGIGLDTYWPQFEGLRAQLEEYQQTIHAKLENNSTRIIDAGLVDNMEKSRSAASLFEREEVRLVFLYISTYALSSTVLSVIQHLHVPVVVLNLQPVS